MARKELKNKPLLEAILEVRWELPQKTPQEPQFDQDYQILLSRFLDKIKEQFPFHEPLPSSQFPPGMVPYIPQHRFRKELEKWPLIQLGYGLMTINATEEYSWSGFEPCCNEIFNCLKAANSSSQFLPINEVSLRYIDAVSCNDENDDIFKFLKDKMKIVFSLPDSLFEGDTVSKTPAAFQWHCSFPLKTSNDFMTIRFGLGEVKNARSFIWETLVHRKKIDTEFSEIDFQNWLKEAHDLTDDWFFKLIEGDLERRFSGD